MLTFKFCHALKDLIGFLNSIKNPYSGKIVAPEIKELIMDERFIDPNKTKIIIK